MDEVRCQVIFTAADGNYATQAQVLAGSLARTQLVETKLIVLGNNWNGREHRKLCRLENDVLSIELREVQDRDFADVRLASKFPLATAYNVLAPRYLLSDQDHMLYVDADIIVRKDLSELFRQPIIGGVAACLDAHIGWVSSPSMWRPWLEEGLAPDTPYLNTGVMLIDTRAWNDRGLTEKTLEYLRKYELPCVDQDALNLALRGEFTQLAPKFNSMPYHILKSFRNIDLVTRDNEVGEALVDPVIIHFHRSFLGKPWEFGCIHPARQAWRSIADDVHPRWRKSIDAVGFGRRKVAGLANMLRMDERARIIEE